MKNNIIKKNGKYTCTKFKQCGGCSYDFDYLEQIQRKQSIASARLSRFGKVKDIIAMDEPYRYRCKVSRVYRAAKNGRLIAGVFKSKSRTSVPAPDCMLEDKRLCEIAWGLGDIFTKYRIAPYDFDTKKGVLKHVMLRKGHRTGQILLCIVTAQAIKNAKGLTSAITERFPDITTIAENISPRSAPMLMGRQETVLYGKGYIEDDILGLRFRISSTSFMQVNPTQSERLYSAARDMLGESTQSIMDAYCGTGTIGLICAGNAKKLTGVELTPAAVEDAQRNAKENGVDNAEFICADAAKYMKQLSDNGGTLDVLIVDPPRAGLDRVFIEAIDRLRPKQIIYISCSLDSLARDLSFIRKLGYKAEEIQPVDMFPHTRHIEFVVKISSIA